MEPLELGKFFVHLLQVLNEKISICIECKRGQGIIKKRLGQPIKWRNKPCWYWKYPFIETFDVVDMRKKYLCLNAHSFHSLGMEESIIPYNIIIDVQIEYRIINPLVIYDEFGFIEGEESNISYISNTVQGILSSIIEEYGIDLNYNTLVAEIKSRLCEYKKEQLEIKEIEDFDISFKWGLFSELPKKIRAEECISISNIVITSFDKNISLRTTI